ncbi:helix-turn-helix domain-containing protein [Candidatus Poriferisodalis sp.]|uniref:helix-turn-helix domain-containing protein n=1 Tax=Candidatus Poriferisodalis sp. TaxID=3101277 RepID=UPI003AF7AFD5
MKASSQNPVFSEPEALGRRLKEAREAIGLPQAVVADHLSIPRASVSDMETGRRRVTFFELKQLTALYRRPFSYFSGDDEDAAVDATAQALYRTTSELSEDDRQQVLRFAQFLREAGRARPPERGGPEAG